jgi:alanine racemase
VEGLYSHLADADGADPSYTRSQVEAFRWVEEQLPSIELRHIANTAALISDPDISMSMVRPGIGIYGQYPSPSLRGEVALTPALSFKTRIARLHWLAPGESVSYNRTWLAQSPTLIALIPVGYGDGLPRSLSNRGYALVNGRRAPIRGRVCMDASLIDVTDVPDVALDDEVVLLGRQGDMQISVEDWADLDGTIHYEILCGLSARVPRLYFEGESLVHATTLLRYESPESLAVDTDALVPAQQTERSV